MSSTTVAEFASELQKPTDLLLEQLKAAGVAKAAPGDALTDTDKQQLLSYLQSAHGTHSAARKKITLTRKSTSEIKQADATGKARTIQVEVRKKRTFIKRDDEVVAPEPVEAPVVAAPAAPVIDEAELARREEEARRQSELLKRQEEEAAEKRRQREAQEQAAEAARVAEAQQAQATAEATAEAPAAEAPPEAAAPAKAPEAPAAQPAQADAQDEAERAKEQEASRRKALAEAEAIRAMMNQPRKVLVAKKPEEPKDATKGTLHKPAGATRAAPPAAGAAGAKEVKSAKLSSSWAGDPAKKKGIPTRGDTGGAGRSG